MLIHRLKLLLPLHNCILNLRILLDIMHLHLLLVLGIAEEYLAHELPKGILINLRRGLRIVDVARATLEYISKCHDLIYKLLN
jgi:hypothetical protein